MGKVEAGMTIKMPESLTAENGCKGLLSGEFETSHLEECPHVGDVEECDDCNEEICSVKVKTTIPWNTIKDIYASTVKHFKEHPELVGK